LADFVRRIGEFFLGYAAERRWRANETTLLMSPHVQNPTISLGGSRHPSGLKILEIPPGNLNQLQFWAGISEKGGKFYGIDFFN